MERKIKKISEKDLKQISQHLHYEINMFWHSYQRTLEDLTNRKTKPMETCFLESCLLHIRNLLEFFIKPTIHNSDIRATNFIDGSKLDFWKIEREKIKSEEELNFLYKRLCCKLSHLSLDRLKKEYYETPWTTEEIEEINKIIYLFLSLAKPDLICDNLKGLVKKT